MIIDFILTIIGVFGTLTIVAYLRQVEAGIAELGNQADLPPICPVCHVSHSTRNHKSMHRSFRKMKIYYKRKSKVAYNSLKRTK